MRKLSRAVKLALYLSAILLILSCNFPMPAREPSGTEQPRASATLAIEPEADITSTPKEEPTSTPKPAADSQIPKVASPVFATYREPKVNVEPSLAPPAVAPGLSNVTVPFALSEGQRERLAEVGFVVTPGTEKEFFMLYEEARYRNVPIFVTSDSLLHAYHLLFDKVLRTAEVEHFIPLLRDLNRAMIAETDGIYQDVQDTPWEDAARRTVAFVGCLLYTSPSPRD